MTNANAMRRALYAGMTASGGAVIYGIFVWRMSWWMATVLIVIGVAGLYRQVRALRTLRAGSDNRR